MTLTEEPWGNVLSPMVNQPAQSAELGAFGQKFDHTLPSTLLAYRLTAPSPDRGWTTLTPGDLSRSSLNSGAGRTPYVTVVCGSFPHFDGDLTVSVTGPSEESVRSPGRNNRTRVRISPSQSGSEE